jgi:hypothetical protein
MRIVRALLGALLWVLAAVVGLVAVILCVTVVLLPLGLPLLNLARQLFTSSVQLMLPRAVAHPVKTLEKSSRKKAGKARRTARDTADALKPGGGKPRWRRMLGR